MASPGGTCDDKSSGGCLRTLITVMALVVVAFVVAVGRIPEGEVAELVTFDRNGRAIGTQLWIVDLDGQAWVRAPGRDASWLLRLRLNPTAHLSRGEGLVSVRAFPSADPKARTAVNRAMARRYGRLERAFHWLRDPEKTVPVRLEKLAPGARGAPDDRSRLG